jgi:cellulose biosynthesis protein BcsQ
MTGKIVTIVNRKGGVAKTTLTLGLADTFCCALEQPYKPEDKRVVVVDLDPQGSVTRALLHDRFAPENEDPLKKVLDDKLTLADFLAARFENKKENINGYLKHGVGPVGADYTLLANEARAWDVERRGIKKPGPVRLQQITASVLFDLARQYKYVLVDCPPGQTVLAEAVIKCSDLILCPVVPDYLSYWGLTSFDDYIREILKEAGRNTVARYVLMKTVANPPRHNPQTKIIEKLMDFIPPGRHVTLSLDPSRPPSVPAALALPLDSHIPVRLNGAPRLNKRWKWEKMYKPGTREKLAEIALGVQYLLSKQEQGDGR